MTVHRWGKRALLGFLSVGVFLFCLLTLPSGVKAAERGEVIIASSSSVFNCKGGDPSTQTGAPPYASRLVFDSVVSVTTDRQLIPSLAKSWKIAPGWEYIDFFMRDDVKFQNGDPVTAEDVVYSLEKFMEYKRYTFSPMWKRIIESIEIPEPNQVRVNLRQADQGFIGRLWWGGGIMPKAYRERVGEEEFARKPIGAGPFKWVDYQQDQMIHVAAVENHYRMTPKVKSLKILFVPDHSTRVAMLRAGEVDIAPILGVHVRTVTEAPGYRIHWTRHVSSSTIVFCDLADPDTPSPFKDIRVRQAVNLAIDRATICEKILFNASEPWGDIIAPITLGYDPTIKPPPYDPEKARALLAEAGYPKGFDTTFNTIAPNPFRDALVANLESVGIRAKQEIYEAGTYYGLYFQKKLKGLTSYVGWYDVEYNAPAELSDFYQKGAVHCYYTSDKVDNMISQGMYSQTDEELAEWGRKLSREIRESLITVQLWANHTPYGLSPRIKSWTPTIGSIPSIFFETIELNE